MRTLRVLIAEEDPTARKATMAIIRALGNVESCDQAASCREVVERCKAAKPHVVALSSKLPAMDALAAVQQMKRLSPKTHVLLLGTQSSLPLERELKRIGDGSAEDPALLLMAIDDALQSELIFLEKSEAEKVH